MAVWRMSVLENQAVMVWKLATEMGIEWWGRQLEVAMGIGWLLQIRKTWPALWHQQSLDFGAEMERRGNKDKDELVKLHYLLFSWRHNVRADGSNGTESIYLPKLQVWCNYLYIIYIY
jgi:hypothetical protein